MSLIGAAAFAIGASGPGAGRAWQAYLVNFVFWTGLAYGAVLLSAILALTGARWAGPVRRLADAFAAFLPVSLLLFGVLWLGRSAIFSSLGQAPPARRLWLSPGFLFARDGFSLLVLAAVGVALVGASLREECGGEELTGAGPARSAVPLATAYATLYAFVLSLLGFDWIMSLNPHWVSTLFGAYYFVGSFYSGLAAVAVVAGLRASRLGGAGSRSRDLGNLLLAFAFTTGYLFYVQFLVIWFGNVSAEARFLILRLRASPWAPLCWVVLALGFGLPVLVLLFRRAKARPAVLAVAAGLSLAGMWLERFLLVAPSLSRGGDLPLGLPELLITAGFFGLLALSLLVFLRRFEPRPGPSPAAWPAAEVPHGRT
jgi:Ni/Fe-hydrogenase subunit HybB-like protein